MTNNTETRLLAIDQGTSSSRAIVFDRNGNVHGLAQEEVQLSYPQDGWVEQDAQQIIDTTLKVVKTACANTHNVLGIGITNQRETTIVWERDTGKAIYPAIVWQDRRGAAQCERLKTDGQEAMLTEKTGLLADAYFSATKLAWILNNVEGARAKAEAGALAFGTVDTWLLWHLTEGNVHATDASNASRTLLFNIHNQQWDEDLLTLFNIPKSLLPDVRDSAADYGNTSVLGGSTPIAGIAGDQQSALFGQACFGAGDLKSTYGTGCFLMQNTGSQALTSTHKLLSTVAWRLNGETTYAVEGSIFMAGATVQWLRDGLGLIKDAAESEALAASLDSNGDVYLVPAHTGLGAPHWNADARGAIVGLTRDSNAAHICRAALEAVCYQTRDLVEALKADGAAAPPRLRVDGGMVNNQWVMQFLSDVLDIPVEKPVLTETTAWGAAALAGLQLGVFESLEDIASSWASDRLFEPTTNREAEYTSWLTALERVQ